ncbi:AAA family ATPase [Streptomyces sp. NPDC087532]|uniref:AAA family ATPase n=1 Tax=Streptomyces sp. NPDC087532 TaxID=3365795 RepID=UPI00380E5E3F
MTSSALEPHLTCRLSDPSAASHPDDETHGWSCQAPGCPAGQNLYRDARDATHDADAHERAGALTVFEPGTLAIFVGPAAAGKSRFASAFPADWVVSLDELHGRLAGDPGGQAATPQAVQIQNLLVESRLERALTTVLDSTNVEPAVRTQLVARAKRWGRPVVAVVFVTELEVCLLRNAQRSANRKVPDKIVEWQSEQTTLSLPQLAGEGFTAIRTVGAGRRTGLTLP